MLKYIVLTLSILASLHGHSQKLNQANWQQYVDYQIDVTLDDTLHLLNAKLELTYTNNSPSELSFIYFHLWPNAYKNRNTAFAKQMEQNNDLSFYYSSTEERGYISDISFSSNDAMLEVVETENIDVVKVLLPQNLKPNQSINIAIPFKVKIPKVFSRLGHEDQDYFITQWYPKPAVYDINGWNEMPYLNQGEFYSEFGSFEVNVTLPENYVIAATGECANDNEYTDTGKEGLGDSLPPSASTFKTITFTAADVHDFAWFASKRFGYVSRKIPVGDREVTARVVASDPNKRDLDHIVTAINYYSEHVGEYPYSHATAVHGELQAGGGMEYPMITVCDQMGEEVIIHEVGHNWFYGILANNERLYPWMDESINSFYEGKAMNPDAKAPANGINEYLMNVLAKDQLITNEYQATSLPSEEFTSNNYGISVYGLGARSFYHLEAYLGQELFKECVNTYYDEWKFKHPLPNDMKNSFEKTSGQELDWFFTGLLATNKKLDYSISSDKNQPFLINEGSVEAPMPIAFMQNGKPTMSWQSAPVGGKVSLVKPIGTFESILLDPENLTNDIFPNGDALHNQFKIKFGTGKDKKGINAMYWIPTIGWNVYDDWMVGLALHNYSISNKAFQYHIVPLYSFENESINGIADINYTFTGNKMAQHTQLGVKSARFAFEERNFGREEYQYFKLSPYLNYNFAKKSLRSPVEKSLKLQFDQILFSPNFMINDDTLRGPQTIRADSRNFATLTYDHKNKRAINGYNFQLMAELGGVNNKILIGDKRVINIIENPNTNQSDTTFYHQYIGEETDPNTFARLSAVLTYNLDIGIEDKPLELRLYGSYLLQTYANTQYKNSIGSTDGAGYYDYRFDDVLMHRNADYGMFRNQISNRRDFSKFVGPIAESDKWLISANATLPLPGKFPVKPYLEVLLFNDIEKSPFNSSGSKFFYNVGLEVEVIPNRLEIFLNLAQSKDVTSFQENSYIGIDTFLERITFVFDLNNLTPPKIKKSVKLF